MQSNNPVFRRSEEFNRGGTATFRDQPAPGQYQPYGEVPAAPGYAPATTGGRMTIDTVVQKTAMSLGVVIVTAMATWLLTGDITEPADASKLFAAVTVGSLAAFVLSMVNSFKRQISPALVLLFCAAEGVALGGLSKVIDMYVSNGNPDNHGVVIQAVAGTFAAFAGTLAAYKFLDIKVTAKFQKFVMAAVFGMIGLSLMELVLGLFGNSIGLFGFGGLGLVTAIVGLALGVFMLIMDFDFVEQGVRNGLPEVESWRAAFAMTVSLVWIYTNLLRLLAILNDN